MLKLAIVKTCPALFIIILSINIGIAQVETVALTTSFQCSAGNVELEIYNGLYDWSTNISPPGGSNGLPVIDKLEIGAVTIANKNNTDGDFHPDGTPKIDSNDPDGVVATSGGRNEIDLMKIVIKKINPSITGFVTLRITGNVALWTSPLKILGSDLTLVNNEVDFLVSELDKTIYVEAIEESTILRDIKFELKYDNIIEDIAKATAFWVERKSIYKTRGNTDFTTYVPNGFPHNPEPWVDLPFEIYSDFALAGHIQTARAIDNSKFGFGPFRAIDNLYDENIGGRILLEFLVKPTPLTPSDLVEFNKLNIRFDIGRVRESETWKYSLGQSDKVITSEEPWPTNLEHCNDDGTANGDEETTLSEESVEFYSYDSPALLNAVNMAPPYYHGESLFKEFARVGFNEGGDPFGGGVDLNSIIGTRCSENIPWRVNYTVKRELKLNLSPSDDIYDNSNHTTVVVETPISHSFPRRTIGSGTGTISINLMPSGSSRKYATV